MTLNGKVSMETDTGSAVSIIAESPDFPLGVTAELMCIFNVKGESIHNIEYESKHYALQIVTINEAIYSSLLL